MSGVVSMFSLYDDLFSSLKSKQKWKCSLMFNARSLLECDPDYVNLGDVLRSKQNNTFPSDFNEIEKQAELLIALHISAIKAGFGLVVRSSKPSGQLDKHHSAYIHIQCQHGVRFRQKRMDPYAVVRLVILSISGFTLSKSEM